MYSNLRAEMSRTSTTQVMLSKKTGISLSCLNLKMNGKRDFRRSEMVKIAEALTTEKRPNLSIDYLFEKD